MDERNDQMGERGLRRTLGLGALIAYGVGDILGAGVYAVVGKIAGEAGEAGWISFLVALTAAAFTALSYAELASRFPRSGSEAYYARQAFGVSWLPLLIGWMVFCSAVVSIAAVSHAFAGYVRGRYPAAPEAILLFAFLLALAGLTFWGIRYSSAANLVCTGVEVAGLVTVLVVGWLFLSDLPDEARASAAGAETVGWSAIFSGAALAFYAFIGFEDMANIAEEVKNPQRALPIGILTSLAVAGCLYVAVIHTASAVIPPSALAASEAPLLDVVERASPGFPLGLFTLIAAFAVTNTALLNFVTASRLIYGMARQRLLPEALGRTHRRTQTPYWAIVAVLAAAAGLSFSGSLTLLAGATSVLLLAVFCVINLALLVLRARRSERDKSFRAPLFAPALGLLCCPALAVFAPAASLQTAALLALAGLPLVLWRRRAGDDPANDRRVPT